jgi:hypothetical protein
MTMTNASVRAADPYAVYRPFLDLVGTSEGTDKGDGYNETLGYGIMLDGKVTKGKGTVETVPATAGTGPNICSMQNNEANYVTFITDGAGIVEWCSTVGAGTTTITLLSYQPLQ